MARAQEDPREGGEGQSSRVPSGGAGESHSGDKAQVSVIHPDGEETPLSHYKGVSLQNVGRDKYGRVIPHKRSDVLAKQIMIWVAGGFNVNDIAIRVNVRPGLIKREYARELAVGETHIHMDVHDHLLKRVKGSDRMAIFYAKARMGWRDGDGANKDQSVLDIHIHL